MDSVGTRRKRRAPARRRSGTGKTLAENRAQFVLTELDLAFTFCQVAESVGSGPAFLRNLKNAKKALLAAKALLDRVPFSPGQRKEAAFNVGRLDRLIERLEQRRTSLEEDDGNE